MITLAIALLLACVPEDSPSDSPSDSTVATTPVLPEGAHEGASLLIVSIDTTRADHLDHAPNLQALLASGVSAPNSVCGAAWTAPCMSSFALGTSAPEAGLDAFRLDIEAGTGGVPYEATVFPEILQEAGYTTLLVSGNPTFGQAINLEQGYEQLAPYTEGDILATSTQFVTKLEGLQRPWFAHLHLMEPHSPYTPPQTWLGCLDGLDPLPEQLSAAEGDILQAANLAWPNLTEAERAAVIAWLDCSYSGEISWLDQVVYADMMASLESKGVLENTMVAAFSDHGEEMGERGKFGHNVSLHSQETSTFVGIFGDGIEPAVWPGFVDIGDIAPTLLTALGIAPPPEMLGSPIGSAPPDRLVPQFHCAGQNQAGSAAQSYALIDGANHLKYLLTTDAKQVFDLAADPAELFPQDPGDDTPEAITSTFSAFRERAESEQWCPAAN